MMTNALPWRLSSSMGWRLLGVLLFLVIWQGLAWSVDSRGILPGPDVVVSDFFQSFLDDPGLRYLGVATPSYALNIAWTLGQTLIAWSIGSLLGASAGLISARQQWARNLTEPLFFVFGAVPALVLAPFLLVWFGEGVESRIALVGFYCFVTVGLVAQSAAMAFPRTTEEYAATLGIDSRRRFLRVIVPGTLPAVLSGLRIALSTAIAVQATVELLGSQFGVGRLITLRASQGDVSGVLGLSIALGLVAMLLDLLLRLGIRRMTRWQ